MEDISAGNATRSNSSVQDIERHDCNQKDTIPDHAKKFGDHLVIQAALTSQRKSVDLDASATVRSIFDDPKLAGYYVPHADYENLHRFDPSERWTYREEQRKIDWKIFLWVLVMFFALNIDGGNLSNAVADNLLDDIGINTNDCNNAQNMDRAGFLISEIPPQMIGKWLGPDRWIPTQIVIWSLASGGQFFMHDRAGSFACRLIIGLAVGGFIPGAILYLSYFYTKAETPLRLALFCQLVLAAQQCGTDPGREHGRLNTAVQLSGIASSNIYREDDKPVYRRGNGQLIAITVGTIAAYGLAEAYYAMRNRYKKKAWESMTSQDKATYLEKNGHLGNKRLDFLFDH